MNRKQLLQFMPDNDTEIRRKARYIYQVLEDHLYLIIKGACKSCYLSPRAHNMITSWSHIGELSGYREDELSCAILTDLKRCKMVKYWKNPNALGIHFLHVPIEIDTNLRYCANCAKLERNAWHPLTDFYKDSKSVSGYRRYCMSCSNEISHKNRNNEKIKERDRRYYDMNKESIKANSKRYYRKNKFKKGI